MELRAATGNRGVSQTCLWWTGRESGLITVQVIGDATMQPALVMMSIAVDCLSTFILLRLLVQAGSAVARSSVAMHLVSPFALDFERLEKVPAQGQ